MILSKNSVCALFLVFLFSVHHIDFLLPYRREASLHALILLCIHDFVRPPYLKPDMVYHHILSMLLCVIAMTHPEWSYEELLPFLKTEISTVFLVLRAYGIHHWTNDLLFASTFAYYRIYGLSRALITTSLDFWSPSRFLGWNLLGLNMYWMIKITRHLLIKKR
jgi:hypothetical protein